MLSRKDRLLAMKIVSLFSVVRGYNIPVIILAQYLSAIFILAPDKGAINILLDGRLFLIVLATAMTIASGYIINNFYDRQKDLINRPTKSMLDRLVSQKTKLYVYFSLNFIAAIIALTVSWRAFIYFSTYIFLIWLYSHKIKRYPFIGNLTATLLAILPFFAILAYYKNFYEVIFAHGSFLYLLLLIREMIKDLENLKGDLASGYQTVPIIYGEGFSKNLIFILFLVTIVPVYFLIDVFDVGHMDFYFYSCYLIMVFFIIKLRSAHVRSEFVLLHNILKFVIVGGVFSIVLINPAVMWHGKKYVERNMLKEINLEMR